MDLKTLLAAAVLALTPAFASAACWEGHQQAMSCEDGYTYDEETQACVVIAS